MTVSRVLSSLTACAAVGGCAALAIGMAHAATRPTAAPASRVAAHPAPTERPAFPSSAGVSTPGPRAAAVPQERVRTSAPARHTASAAPRTTTAPAAAPSTTVAPSTVAPTSSTPTPAVTTRAVPPSSSAARPTSTHPATARPAARPAAKPAKKPATQPATHAPVHHTTPGHALPAHYSVGSATRVVTVTASSHHRTTATLQAWTKLAPGHWVKHGGAITAHVGADGIGQASETTSKTPQGSFTLTQAFGHNSDPGTSLPYFRTNPSDYWISDGGSKYNTHQRCGHCGYNDGVNERLYYETPYYNYAVVIDYNTRNAPGGVHQGKGSAFFLHVTDGNPTAGCVAIPQSQLISLMRWLKPSTHPRIVIQVS